MSRKKIDLEGIALSPTGRIILADEDLEAAVFEPTTMAGGATSNGFSCTNNSNCGNTANYYSCTNANGACDGAYNHLNCQAAAMEVRGD